MLDLLLRPRAAALAVAAVLSLALIAPAAANADTSSTLTVVGTSDVSDSGLVPNVIMPQFKRSFPQYHVQVRRLGDRQPRFRTPRTAPAGRVR